MKKRLDLLILERGLVPTRQAAQGLILRGEVLVNGVPETKAGTSVKDDAEIRLRSEPPRFVGRGGEKIDPVFDEFGVDPAGLVAVDIGSSTGGFTDVLLKRGAKRVYAVDVGTNQLDYRLRVEPRVTVMEQQNAKDLTPEHFPEPPQLCTIDVSFIGLRKILLPVMAVLSPPWKIIMLVKPQFELGPEYIEKGGIVRKEEDQKLAVELVTTFLQEAEAQVKATVPSSLRGAKSGNQEYFILASSE